MMDEQDLPAYAQGGLTLTFDYSLVEDLAFQGLSDLKLAAALRISPTTWAKYELRDEQLATAVSEGRKRVAIEVLNDLKRHSKRHTGVAASIFLAKQEHILAFRDERYNKTEISLHVTPAMLAFAKSRKQLDVDVIEVESDPIEE